MIYQTGKYSTTEVGDRFTEGDWGTQGVLVNSMLSYIWRTGVKSYDSSNGDYLSQMGGEVDNEKEGGTWSCYK